MQQELATLLRSKPESLSHSNFNTLFLRLITSIQEAEEENQNSPQLMRALRTISEFGIEDCMSEATFRLWAVQSWIREEAEVVEVEEAEVVEVEEEDEVVEVEVVPEQRSEEQEAEAESEESDDSDSSDSDSSDSECEAKTSRTEVKTARPVSDSESDTETNTASPAKKIPVITTGARPFKRIQKGEREKEPEDVNDQASPAKKIPVITTGARPFKRIQKGEREKEPEDVNDQLVNDLLVSDTEEDLFKDGIPKKPYTPSPSKHFQEQYNKYKSKKSSIQEDPELPFSPVRSLFKEGKTFNCCCCC